MTKKKEKVIDSKYYPPIIQLGLLVSPIIQLGLLIESYTLNGKSLRFRPTYSNIKYLTSDCILHTSVSQVAGILPYTNYGRYRCDFWSRLRQSSM